MTDFKGWAAFSVYCVEGEDGAIYLSANGVKAKCAFTTSMGRALGQLAAIQAQAASPESGPSQTLDEPLNPPNPDPSDEEEA